MEGMAIGHNATNCVSSMAERNKKSCQWAAYCLLGNCTCFSFSCHHQMLLQGVGSQMNKFEQVPNDHHKMSLAQGSPGLISRGRRGGGPKSDVQGVPYLTFPGGGLSYHIL